MGNKILFPFIYFENSYFIYEKADKNYIAKFPLIVLSTIIVWILFTKTELTHLLKSFIITSNILSIS